jgi:hypothetical protein
MGGSEMDDLETETDEEEEAAYAIPPRRAKTCRKRRAMVAGSRWT